MNETRGTCDCLGGYVYADPAEELRRRGEDPDKYPTARFMKPCPTCAVRDFIKRIGGREMTWENWIHRARLTEAVAAFTDWYPHDENQACLLHGGYGEEISGNGKTHLLSATGIEFIRKGRKVKYVNAADLAENKFEPWFIEVIGNFVGLVLLDDLGNDPNYPMNRDSVDRLLDFRYRHRRATIVATRLSLEKIETRYHRFHSRMISGTKVELSASAFERGCNDDQSERERLEPMAEDPEPCDTSDGSDRMCA